MAIAFAGILATASYIAGAGQGQHQPPGSSSLPPEKEAANAPGQAQETLAAIHSQRVPSLQASVEQILRYVEAGQQAAALEELRRLQSSLQALHQAIGSHVKPSFVNIRCPIMRTPIQPDKVTADLTRQYQGQNVAFCCAGCPQAWDRLTDAEKTTKLRLVVARPPQRSVGSKPVLGQPSAGPRSTPTRPAPRSTTHQHVH